MLKERKSFPINYPGWIQITFAQQLITYNHSTVIRKFLFRRHACVSFNVAYIRGMVS